MPTYEDENLVMWRSYAHLVPLMDLLRLRHAGWVVESTDDEGVHLGVVHAAAAHATPMEAAKYLDVQAAMDRKKREQDRALRERSARAPRDADDRSGPRGGKRDDEAANARVTTSRARAASRRSTRRHTSR